MTESRAAGPGNRAALYSVESPRRSLALDPDPAGCERPPHMLNFVCVCTCVFLLCSSPRMLSHQLAAEQSLKCSGSDEMQ